jgi:hypothetical protein
MELYRIVFIVISIAPFLLGIKLFLNYQDFKRKAVFAKGKVIDVVEKQIDSFGEKTIYYFPVITFNDYKGNNHKVCSEIGEGTPSKIIIGKPIDILYNREDPSDVLTKGNNNLLFPILMFGLFLIFLVIGFI